MATLATPLLSHFTGLFVFLFVLIAVYAILKSIKFFSDKDPVNVSIALLLAIFFSLSSTASKIFQYSTPWLVLLFIFLIFVELIFKFTGAESHPFRPKDPVFMSIIFIAIIFIFVFSAGQVFKEKRLAAEEAQIIDEVDSGAILTFPGQVGSLIKNPAVLGMLVIAMIATFAIILLASDK